MSNAKANTEAVNGPNCLQPSGSVVLTPEQWRAIRDNIAHHSQMVTNLRIALAYTSETVSRMSHRIHTNYDWNADPDSMTREAGDVVRKANALLSPNNAIRQEGQPND